MCNKLFGSVGSGLWSVNNGSIHLEFGGEKWVICWSRVDRGSLGWVEQSRLSSYAVIVVLSDRGHCTIGLVYEGRGGLYVTNLEDYGSGHNQ